MNSNSNFNSDSNSDDIRDMLKQLMQGQAANHAESNARFDKLETELVEVKTELVEVKTELAEIKEVVLIIKKRVVPIDLIGITPETQKTLQEEFSKAYESFEANPQEFDPRINTKADPTKTSHQKATLPEFTMNLNNWRRLKTMRLTSILNNPNISKGDLIKAGDFLSKIFTLVFEFDFQGNYADGTLAAAESTLKYFFEERVNSPLAKINGRLT